MTARERIRAELRRQKAQGKRRSARWGAINAEQRRIARALTKPTLVGIGEYNRQTRRYLLDGQYAGHYGACE